jgi:protein-L-isoaspartate(D-aspartate) O-methyltransferase
MFLFIRLIIGLSVIVLVFVSCGGSAPQPTSQPLTLATPAPTAATTAFSWAQIKAMIDKNLAAKARDFNPTEAQWTSAVQKYEDNAVATIARKVYTTPELTAAFSVVPRPFFAYNYETNKNRMDQTGDFLQIIDIGYGSTMSAPSIQSYMTANLEPKKTDIALEIGTGSGVQSAILSRLVKQVYTIEIREKLGKRVAETLKTVGYDNIETKIGDGYYGWAEKAPFDIIIVTCQANHIPPDLIKQLKPNGRMVIPVGPAWSTKQQMLKVTLENGKVVSKKILAATQFIPMLGANETKKP